MSIQYVGPDDFDEPPLDAPLAGGHTEGEAEAAAAFVAWIERGFPAELTVARWASDSGSGVYRMRASDLVEAAVRMFTLPLPMPEHLASMVREYVAPVPLAESVADEDEPLTWVAAIFDLKTALAYRHEHAAEEVEKTNPDNDE